MCRCVLQCQDEVKDKVSLKNLKIVCFCCPLSVTQTQLLSFKVGPNTPESEMRKFRGEFETCAIACCDKWLLKAKMINMWLLKCWLLDKCLIVEIVAKLTFPSQVNQQDAQPVDQAQGCFWEWKTLVSRVQSLRLLENSFSRLQYDQFTYCDQECCPNAISTPPSCHELCPIINLGGKVSVWPMTL